MASTPPDSGNQVPWFLAIVMKLMELPGGVMAIVVGLAIWSNYQVSQSMIAAVQQLTQRMDTLIQVLSR